jgi:hypothetical protein
MQSWVPTFFSKEKKCLAAPPISYTYAQRQFARNRDGFFKSKPVHGWVN